MQIRFNDDVRNSTAAARAAAAREGAVEIEPRHLLLGLLRGSESGTERVLMASGIDVYTLRGQIENELAPSPASIARSEIPYTTAAQRVIGSSMDEARLFGAIQVGSEHLLLGILRLGGPAADVLLGMGLTLERLRRQIANGSSR